MAYRRAVSPGAYAPRSLVGFSSALIGFLSAPALARAYIAMLRSHFLTGAIFRRR